MWAGPLLTNEYAPTPFSICVKSSSGPAHMIMFDPTRLSPQQHQSEPIIVVLQSANVSVIIQGWSQVAGPRRRFRDN